MKDFYGKNCDAIKKKKLFLFDMDGTVYLENTLFDGVKELCDRIVKGGGRFVFVTNNSSKSVADYAEKLRRMGLNAGEEEVYTSTLTACAVLKEKFSDKPIYAQGTRSFLQELKRNGVNAVTQFRENIAAVIVGFDPELTGEKLRTTCRVLTLLSVPYYATNPDWVCPVEFGFVPDCGSMCFGIQKATGKSPEYFGKPHPYMIETLMKKFGATKEETLVVGDRLYTDIASGVNAGVQTVCVLSGESSEEDIKASSVKPDFVFESVKQMIF